MIDLTKEEAAALLCYIDDFLPEGEEIIQCSQCPNDTSLKNCSAEFAEQAIEKLKTYIKKVVS